MSLDRNYAVAVLAPNDNGVKGTVHFRDTADGVVIMYDIDGLADGEHGFHIHEYGDLTDGCDSACAHFNPFNKNHGGLDSAERHEGDLGNITSKNGKAKGEMLAKTLSLNPMKITCILGRMIIVHEDRDDLGLGGLNKEGKIVDESVHKESLKTGNAGKRLGCGVIGLQEPPNGKPCGMKAESIEEKTSQKLPLIGLVGVGLIGLQIYYTYIKSD